MFISQKPKILDALLLSLFAVLITWQPYYAQGDINIFETGLYLPGIRAVLNGEILYRDVLHLRGPFDIYMPALLMKVFGEHLTVLYGYFYFGNVLCLVLCVWIAREILKTRYLYYLLIPVLVGRTFPRVVFTYWGGMRYAFGLLAVLCAIRFFKTKKSLWMVFAGIFTACGALTSVEMGVYAVGGVLGGLVFACWSRYFDLKRSLKALRWFALGAAIIVLPVIIHFAAHGALRPFIDAVKTVILHSHGVMDQRHVAYYPRTALEALGAMVNPSSKNFRHLTPAYMYLFLLWLFYQGLRHKKISRDHVGVATLALYGLIMYVASFRSLWGSQFEMALQPEKILLFFNLEVVFLYFLKKKRLLLIDVTNRAPLPWHDKRRLRIYFINFCFAGLFLSSVGYPLQRFSHRFIAFQYVSDKLTGKDTEPLKPFYNQESKLLSLEKAKGVRISSSQARELEKIQEALRTLTDEEEAVLLYPELGAYSFLFDRPFFGRFPMATFTWFNDRWHREYMAELNERVPRTAVVKKEWTKNKVKVYFAYEPNKRKHEDFMRFLNANYEVVTETKNVRVYQKK